MNRLTKRREDGSAAVGHDLLALELMEGQRVAENMTPDGAPTEIDVMVHRLCAYEDTGLEPEEILPAIEKARIDTATAIVKAYESALGDWRKGNT